MENEIFIALNNFNRPSSLAIYGAHLAKQINRPIFLFGITRVSVATPPTVLSGNNIQNSVSDKMTSVKLKAERKLEEIVLDVKQIHQDVNGNTEFGYKESSIISKTEKRGSHLVLLEGVNELTTLHEWFGTYETRLAEEVNAPVLIVPENYTWNRVKNILYVMDLDDDKIDNVRYLVDLSKELKAQLNVVTISNDKAKDNGKYDIVVNILQHLVKGANIQFYRIFTDEPSDSVEKIMLKTDADWLAFEHKSRSFIERVFNDYNTKNLILQSQKPVLVF